MWRESKTKAHLKVWNSIWFALIVRAWHSVFQCVPVCSRVFQCVFHLLSYFLVEVLLPLTVNILLDKYLMKIWLITDNHRQSETHTEYRCTNTHIHTHTHTWTQTRTHTFKHTHIHKHTHTNTPHTQADKQKHTHICTNTHKNTKTHTPKHKHKNKAIKECCIELVKRKKEKKFSTLLM